MPMFPTKSRTRFASVSHGVREDSIKWFQPSSNCWNGGWFPVVHPMSAPASRRARAGSDVHNSRLRVQAGARRAGAGKVDGGTKPVYGAQEAGLPSMVTTLAEP